MNLIKSLLILFLVSTVFSLPLSNTIFGFCKWFVVFSIIQIIIWNIYNNYLKLKTQQLKLLKESELEKQGVDIICPCYKETKMFIPIRIDKDNSFKCLECKKNVAVSVKIETAMETESLDLEKEDLELKAALKKIKENID